MPRIKKSIKPDLELFYNLYSSAVLPDMKDEKNILKRFISEEFIKRAKKLKDNSMRIVFRRNLNVSSNSSFDNRFVFHKDSYSYYGEDYISFSASLRTNKFIAQSISAYASKNWTTIRDYEKAPEYIEELFGKPFKVQAEKKTIKFLDENPFDLFLKDQFDFLIQSTKDFLIENDIDFDFSITDGKETFIVDFKQFTN